MRRATTSVLSGRGPAAVGMDGMDEEEAREAERQGAEAEAIVREVRL